MHTITPKTAVRAAILALLMSVTEADAADVTVMSSGGLTAAFQAVVPGYEAASGNHVRLVLGPSMGTSPDAIPYRLSHGETADVVLMVGAALGDLVAKGVVEPSSRVDVANSKIGLAVRAGAPVPDITTPDAFKRALLAAKSVAYSDSASGVYVEREMYAKLGITAEMKAKSRMIVAERVGNVVARGDAEIGLQQVAELLPIGGITYVGEIPDAAQEVTLFSAGIPKAAANKTLAEELIAYLTSGAARPILVKTGLSPIVKGP